MAKAASFVPTGYHTMTPQLPLDQWIATRKEELTKAEVEQRANQHFANMAQAPR